MVLNIFICILCVLVQLTFCFFQELTIFLLSIPFAHVLLVHLGLFFLILLIYSNSLYIMDISY